MPKLKPHPAPLNPDEETTKVLLKLADLLKPYNEMTRFLMLEWVNAQEKADEKRQAARSKMVSPKDW